MPPTPCCLDRVCCTEAAEAAATPPTRLPTCRQLRCCIGVLACASGLTSGPAHTTTALAVPCCREYPTTADAYDLVEECGRGVSATVSRSLAWCSQRHTLVGCSTCLPAAGRAAMLPRCLLSPSITARIVMSLWQVYRAICKPFQEEVRALFCGPVLASWRLGGGLWHSSLPPPLCPFESCSADSCDGRIQLPMFWAGFARLLPVSPEQHLARTCIASVLSSCTRAHH